MMAPSAWLALWDFITRPHHWHKTPHGLSRHMQAVARPHRPINPAS
jgi:hypothetical protein